MQVDISHIPFAVNKYQLKRSIADVVRSEQFPRIRRQDEEDEDDEKYDKYINFDAQLNPSKIGGAYGDGSGYLTFSEGRIVDVFLRWVRVNPIRIEGKALRFHRSSIHRGSMRSLAETLSKTPYIDPKLDEDRDSILWRLKEIDLRVTAIQFGVLYRPYYPTNPKTPPPNRHFSKEYEQNYTTAKRSLGWLRFEYDHKLIRIALGDEMTQRTGSNIVIAFANVDKVAIGFDPNPYLCFDTFVPPMIQEIDFHAPITGDPSVDSKKYRRRVSALDDAHARVGPYSHKIRVELYNDYNVDVIDQFVYLWKTAGMAPSLLIKAQIETSKRNFFSAKMLHKFETWLKALPWPVAFQLEMLLRNSLLNTEELLGPDLYNRVNKLCLEHSGDNGRQASQIISRFGQALISRLARESPADCFDRVVAAFVPPPEISDKGLFECCHVSITPTRLLLEGPYASQSNRIIRLYPGKEEHFVRVDFRDEDRLTYRWDKDVDGVDFLDHRVGDTLKHGFSLAGRRFEFLAYSSSALREHAVWFICPFEFLMPQRSGSTLKVVVNAEYVRRRIGDFEDSPLMRQPSKFAARLAQAFTATDPSVSVYKHEWEVVDDIGLAPHLHTDGCGTVSKSLGDRIWAALCANRRDGGQNSIQPSAYQIRFLGYKGMVSVDENMDAPIHMRLRYSMEKFQSSDADKEEADIEIARAFEAPNTTYLNRPLVMVLEDRKVKKEEFMNLQEESIREARTIHDSIPQFRHILKSHGLGRGYRLEFLMAKIQGLGLDFRPKIETPRTPGIENAFMHHIRSIAMTAVLRDIKHGARIKVPHSYMLVGVADEGPAYVAEGKHNVFSLPSGHIYACVQLPGEEPKWLHGRCLVSRSPVVHPGDVQRVHAIGKPPGGLLCSFRNKKNVVVFSSLGHRSLASCLAGGDLDGDLYDIIQYSPLFLSDVQAPAEYPAGATLTLDRPIDVQDICDFIVSYISSDVLGLLSDRHLVIADQSTFGTRDKSCLMLAELCSQAVDYPKNGVPVNIDKLPHTLIRCKPDWHAAEISTPRETDYYRSDKALGHLYRAITLEDPLSSMSALRAPLNPHPLSDPISEALKSRIQAQLDSYNPPDGKSSEIRLLLKRYVDELSYICSTHTVSNTPGVKLLEGEVVIGTILAKCSQRRWRKDRIFRMRTTASVLVREVQRSLFPSPEVATTREDLENSLRKGWEAWDLSQRAPPGQFGCASFGLVALGVIFDVLEKLEAFSTSPSSNL